MNNIVLYQNIKDLDGMKKGLAMVKTKLEAIGFPISIGITPTEKVFTGVNYPASIEIPLIAPDGVQILQEVKGKYKVATLIYDWDKVTPKPNFPTHHNYLLGGCTPNSIPVQFYTDTTVTPQITYPEVLCLYYLHELNHAIAFLTGQPDKTHFQYANLAWSQKPPIDYYVHLIEELKPYWFKLSDNSILPQPEPIKAVTLTRRWDNGVQTLGELSFDDFNCKTLELPYRDNKQNISCIPKGTYTVKWSFSPKFMRYTYEILKVPNRSGIRFHSGSSFYDIKGCILLGTHYTDINGDPYADIAGTKETIARFDALLKKKSFKLIIR